jgi:2-haloacid dehalogenase
MVTLLAGMAVTAAAAPRPTAHRDVQRSGGFKAVVFDYLVLFNPDSIVSEVERAFPGQGKELTNRWRTRQFEYSWLRSITDQYVDFLAITEDALVYAVDTMKLTLTSNDRRRLLDAYLHLEPWPDTMEALAKLRASGVSIVTLANFSPTMLRLNAENAGLTRFVDLFLSTDLNHTYKPDPRAYRLALDHLGLSKQEILFAAFGGWDAAGAKAFGYPTFWVNRFNQPLEQLGNRPDGTADNLEGLLHFVLNGKARQAAAKPSRTTLDRSVSITAVCPQRPDARQLALRRTVFARSPGIRAERRTARDRGQSRRSVHFAEDLDRPVR